MKHAQDNQYIVLGKIGSTYGAHGWLKIHTYTEYGANILDYHPWYLKNAKDEDEWQSIEVETGKLHNNGIIVKLKGINNPEDARLYTGQMIGILRAQLPALNENEYYWSDLVGLTVINQRGETLGKVIYLMETGSNDVLVVKGAKEHAIPFLIDKVITQIDLNKKEIHVDWELI